MPFELLRDDAAQLEFAAFIPENFARDAHLPIIVFLHGSGERGFDRGLPLKGNAHVFENLQLPAVVIFPQCDYEHRAFYGEMETQVFKSIDFAARVFGLDTQKIFLSGYSMGGSSTLWLGAKHAEKIAAIACIAPGITWMGEENPPRLPDEDEELFNAMFVAEDRTKKIAERIKDIPLWFLQGTQDEPCPIEETRMLVDEMRNLGSKPLFTEYYGVDHESLTLALEQEGLFGWLLSQK